MKNNLATKKEISAEIVQLPIEGGPVTEENITLMQTLMEIKIEGLNERIEHLHTSLLHLTILNVVLIVSSMFFTLTLLLNLLELRGL